MMESNWYMRKDAFLLWATILLTGLCMALGGYLDSRWRRMNISGDMHFLVVDEQEWLAQEAAKKAGIDQKVSCAEMLFGEEMVQPFRDFAKNKRELGFCQALDKLFIALLMYSNVQVVHMQTCAALFMQD